jgi:RimJ/RimL family protein N-acetyltransferase
MREYARQGFAREAVVASIDYAFEVLGWDEVIHVINSKNTASVALAERLGSRDQGPSQMPAPYENLPVNKYWQTKANWMTLTQGI